MRAGPAGVAGQRQHLGGLREAAAAVAALALSLIVVAHLVATERSALLFTDGDSVITVLITRSLSAGEPQDWAMSSVLFLPEIAVFWLLSLLGLPIMATLLLNAVLNFVALYLALRFVTREPVAALAAFAAFAALALLESSGSRESLELASLLATTTYYSATVIGVLVTLGLLLRLPGGRALLVAVAAVALVSTASNPIYLAWAVLPFALLLIAARHLPVRARVLGLIALGVGAALGMLVRVPLAPWITNTGAGYAQPSQWSESARYYGDLVADRAQDAGGIASLLAWGILVALGVTLTVLCLRRRQLLLASLAAASWMAPLLIIVGAVALGTHASRYIQPAVFLPVLAVAVLVAVVQAPHRLLGDRLVDDHLVGARPVVPGAALVLAIVAVVLLPGVVQAGSRQHPDADVACVTEWVAESGEVGAGQFWTIRAAKAYADDPSALVQVDLQLNSYEWLVNRQDFAVERVSFLVSDELSFAFDLPPRLASATTETIDCGRYTITDFGRPIVVLGPPHS